MRRALACLLIAPWICAVTAAQVEWREFPHLAGRAGAAMAYDPVRQRVVLFGGFGVAISDLGDTWEWNGRTWQPRFPSTSPPARGAAAMAFDPVRQRILLLGGLQQYASGRFRVLGDMWEWDGRDWTEIKGITLPSARLLASIATDPVRKRVVLFGGAVPSPVFPRPLDDTWEWDGRAWRQLTPRNVPGARFGPAMAFHEASKRIVMVGGNAFWTARPMDVLEWDGSDWTTLSPKARPELRRGHAVRAEPTTGHVLVYGGVSAQVPYRDLDDLWRWNGSTWQQLAPTTSPGQGNMAIVEDPAHGRVLLCGGYEISTNRTCFRTWSWDGSDWSLVHETAEAGGWSSLAHDAARDQIVVVGPELYDAKTLGTWTLEEDGLYHKLTPLRSPPGRKLPGLVYFPPLAKVVLFGGAGRNDHWLWDGKTWTEDTRQPRPSYGGWDDKFAYDSGRRKIVYVANKETWEWDAAGWSLRGTFPLPFGPIAYDPVRKRTVLAAPPKTLEWDGSSWTTITPNTAPQPGTLVYSPQLGGVVMVGDAVLATGTVNGNTWLWTGQDWVRQKIDPLPQVRGNWAATYDSTRRRVVVVHSTPIARRAWELGSTALRTTTHHPRPGERFSMQVDLLGEAGRPFLLAFSEGTHPGIPLLPVPDYGLQVLPLAPDPLFWLSLGIGMTGRLDGAGRLTLPLQIPNDPALRWFRFHAAGLTVGPGGVSAITNRVPLQIVR